MAQATRKGAQAKPHGKTTPQQREAVRRLREKGYYDIKPPGYESESSEEREPAAREPYVRMNRQGGIDGNLSLIHISEPTRRS